MLAGGQIPLINSSDLAQFSFPVIRPQPRWIDQDVYFDSCFFAPSLSTCMRTARAAQMAWVSVPWLSCGCSTACSATASQPNSDLCWGTDSTSENSTQVGRGHLSRVAAWTSSFSSTLLFFIDPLLPWGHILLLDITEILIRNMYPVFSLTSCVKQSHFMLRYFRTLIHTDQ